MAYSDDLMQSNYQHEQTFSAVRPHYMSLMYRCPFSFLNWNHEPWTGIIWLNKPVFQLLGPRPIRADNHSLGKKPMIL